ncbi:MAG: sigma-54 dependent transcriptional regulator [Cytophagales bacterium]|nr:sigma-54 dependent transcriptional regulator [Cytophagales bacterium]MDW8385069.1 sigma-54 dependent transcriptional regulator [Flammeovirgaceae bacterium]
MPRILIVDDEKSIRDALRDILLHEKYSIDEAKDGEEAYEKLLNNDYDVVLCDVKLPKMDGIELLSKMLEQQKDVQFIMISAHANLEMAMQAAKKGAFDFFQKPPDLNKLLISIRNATDKSNLVQETKLLRKKVDRSYEIIGETPAMLRLKEDIAKVASTDARVLILGPNGAGKELVARSIHRLSNRANMRFVEVNCAAIPSELIESQLFGHEKGSFTGAFKQHIGKFEQADGGTIFLDEIGDMSLSAQAKVLRVLEEQKISRIGSDKDIKVNVRVLAATNKNLQEEIKKGNFREDLYHRLAVIVLRVPALDERKEDIPLLVDKFLQDFAEQNGRPVYKITPEAKEKLKEYSWPGNIRELRNVVERLIIMCDGEITVKDVERYRNH